MDFDEKYTKLSHICNDWMIDNKFKFLAFLINNQIIRKYKNFDNGWIFKTNITDSKGFYKCKNGENEEIFINIDNEIYILREWWLKLNIDSNKNNFDLIKLINDIHNYNEIIIKKGWGFIYGK